MSDKPMANMEHENERPTSRRNSGTVVIYPVMGLVGIISGVFIHQALMGAGGFSSLMAFLIGIGSVIGATAFTAIVVQFTTRA